MQDQIDQLTREKASLLAQLEAIGAGGVESLRKPRCLHRIHEPAPAKSDFLTLSAAASAVAQPSEIYKAGMRLIAAVQCSLGDPHSNAQRDAMSRSAADLHRALVAPVQQEALRCADCGCHAPSWCSCPDSPTNEKPGTEERDALEAWAKNKEYDLSPWGDTYDSDYTSNAWDAWQARAALAATPAADAPGEREDFAWLVVQEVCETEPADEDDPECIRILRRDLKTAVLAAFLRADATPAAVKSQLRTSVEAIESGHDHFCAAVLRGKDCDCQKLAASSPVVLPEQWPTADDVALAYEDAFAQKPQGRLWANITVLAEALRSRRALLAEVSAPAALAVERGEVLVTVSGFTGSGKSAIAGEIEIMCRALGLQVEWPDSDSEKHMTHADWIAALEQYKPRVRIVECNVPHSVVKGQDK